MSISSNLEPKVLKELNPLLVSLQSVWSREMLDNKIDDEGLEQIEEEFGISIDEVDRISDWWNQTPIFEQLVEKFSSSLESMLKAHNPDLEFCFDNWVASDYWRDFIRELWDNSFDPDYPEVDWFLEQGISDTENGQITDDQFSDFLDAMSEWMNSDEVVKIFRWLHKESFDFLKTINRIS